MIITLAILVGLLIFLFLSWWFFIRPLFVYRHKLTHEIREEVFPSIVDIDKTAITIASAAVVLTMPILKEASLISKEYLMASWICFAFSILAGLIVLLAHHTDRFMDKIMLREVSEMEKDKTRAAEARTLLDKRIVLTRILFATIYLQISMVFIAIATLVIFGIYNLHK